MSALTCVLWWFLLGAFVGWLASWMLSRAFRRDEPAPIERVVDRLVDNPAHLERIRTLEGEVGQIAGLRSQVSQLQAAPPKIVEKVVEKIVERPVDRIVEKIVERPVERIVEKVVEKPVDRVVERVIEKLVQDTRGIEERDRIIAARDEEIARLRRPPDIDLAAAKAAGFKLKNADDLEIIEGIGPKIAQLLRDAGVNTFAALSRMTPAQIQPILDKAGAHFKLADPATWPEQAGLAASNRWGELKALQDALDGGKR
jgi:predicted flap endonuclease-1-like 5' DNA nuclease